MLFFIINRKSMKLIFLLMGLSVRSSNDSVFKMWLFCIIKGLIQYIIS